MKFQCFWSADAFAIDKDKTEVHGTEIFSDKNGYNSEEIEAISALEVGQTWTSPAYGNFHTITRIE